MNRKLESLRARGLLRITEALPKLVDTVEILEK